MDFQEAFLVLYWPAWSRMLGLFVATIIILSMYHIITYSHRFRRPSKRDTFAGQKFE